MLSFLMLIWTIANIPLLVFVVGKFGREENRVMGQTESTPCASPEPTPEQQEDGLENSVVDTGAEKQPPEQRQNSSHKIVQAQPCADAITLDKKAAERKLNGARDINSDENLNKPEPKSRAFKNAAKMVQQVASVKMFLSSFKKDSEYVLVEIPKRPDDHAADLGFTLHGGFDNPRIPGDPGVFINHVIPGSSVDRKLRPGDRVLSINGINVTQVPLKYARQAVTKAKGVVRLYIKKAPRREQRINEAIRKENEQDVPIFSKEQIEEFEDAFSVYDVRGSGKIRVGAVFPLIRSLGHNPLEAKVWVFMNELGLTANRKLKFAEFLRLMAALIIDEENNEEQTRDSIRVFDSEERGYFSSEELKTALKRMPGSSQIRDFEMRDILRKADPDEDGKINIQDFQRLLEPLVRLK